MPEKPDLRWGIEQRLEFIEFRLFWKGRLKRCDLMEAFGVLVNQASTDLTQYIGLVLDNLIYNSKVRTYLQGSKSDRLFFMPGAGHYLTLIRSASDALLDQVGAWIGQFLSYNCQCGALTPKRYVKWLPQFAIRSNRGQISVPILAGTALAMDCATRNWIRWVPLACTGLLPHRPELQRLPSITDHRNPRYQADRGLC